MLQDDVRVEPLESLCAHGASQFWWWLEERCQHLAQSLEGREMLQYEQEALISQLLATAETPQAITEPFMCLQPLNCRASDHRAFMFCILRNEALVK